MRQLGLALLLIARVMYGQVQVPEEGTIKLNGEWNLVLSQFVSAEEIDSYKSVKVNVPGTWNGVEWNGENFSGQGFGTYHIPVDLSSGTDDISLYMPSIGLAYRIYINSYELGAVGIPGTTAQTTLAKVKPTVFRIPNRFRGRKVNLIVHVANFSHQNGGIWFSPEIGNANYYSEQKIRSMIISLLVLGSILIIMVYHFFIYALRPREKYSLLFAMICFCMLVHIMTQGDIVLVYLIPSLSWSLIFKIGYSSLIMTGALNLSFIHKLYPSITSTKVSRYIMLVSSAFASLVWLVPTTISYYLVPPFQITTILIGVYLMGVLTVAARKELSGARILLVGFAFTFITALHDILNSQFIIESTPIIHFGVFIYILTLSLVLAKKFVRFINANERLKFELSSLNEELEERVKVRTSELQSQEELVKEKNVELEQANHDLNQLMTILAHDLKSPLLNINSLSQMMSSRLDESLHQSNSMMQKIANDGVSMIDSLISMNKLESEDIRTRIKSFDLSRFMMIKVAEFEPQAEAKRQKLISDIAPDIQLESSERHLSQVLDNLLSNSIKFSPPETRINLTMEKNQNEILITIKDEGPGFSEMDKIKAFGKFQKLSARPTAGESSSGLGLSIVKLLVDKLEGNIHLESEKGNGAKFMISFPYSFSSTAV